MEVVLRGWLTAGVAFVLASGVLTLATGAHSPGLQFVQVAHSAVGLVVMPIWVAYVAVHLAQFVRDRRRVAWRAAFAVLTVLVVPVTRAFIGAALNHWLNRFVAVIIGFVVLLTLRAFWRAVRHHDSPWALGALFLGCSIFTFISGLLSLADAEGSFYAAHVVSTVFMTVAAIAHVTTSRRSTRRREFPWAAPLRRITLPVFVGLSGLIAALAVAVQISARLPGLDERAIASTDRAFTESAADVCDDCHATVVHTWERSSHARAASNPVFTELFRRAVADGRGAEARRCLACHAPHAADPTVFAADEVIASEGFRAGVHCVSCHRMTGAPGLRDGDLEVRPFARDPSTFLVERGGELARGLRAHPFTTKSTVAARIDRHRAQWRGLHDRPTSCRPCHVQTLGPMTRGELTAALQDQYGAWQASPAASSNRDCVDCHMRPVYGAEGYVLNDHRFAAASTYVARVADGEMGERAAVASLEGRWEPPLGSIPPETRASQGAARYGGDARSDPAPTVGPRPLLEMSLALIGGPSGPTLRVGTWNSGQIGHDFPNGPTDLVQVWLRLRATDSTGAVLVEQGWDGPRGATRLGHRLVDARDIEVREHRLWEVATVIDLGRIPSQGRHEVDIPLPGPSIGSIHVDASWCYRRLDPALVRHLVGEPADGLPIVVVGHAEGSLS